MNWLEVFRVHEFLKDAKYDNQWLVRGRVYADFDLRVGDQIYVPYDADGQEDYQSYTITEILRYGHLAEDIGSMWIGQLTITGPNDPLLEEDSFLFMPVNRS